LLKAKKNVDNIAGNAIYWLYQKKGALKMRKQKSCWACGATLDPQESCDCERDVAPKIKEKVTLAPLTIRCFSCPHVCEGGHCSPPPKGFFDKLIDAVKKG